MRIEMPLQMNEHTSNQHAGIKFRRTHNDFGLIFPIYLFNNFNMRLIQFPIDMKSTLTYYILFDRLFSEALMPLNLVNY